MAAADDDKKEEKSGGSGKWWEFYLVRYALGTVFGILIVYSLAKSGLPIPFPAGTVNDLTKPEGIALLLGYGLAYCYLASAPILVFHASRFSMHPIKYSFLTIFFIALSGAVIIILGIYFNEIKSRNLYVFAPFAVGGVFFLILLQVRALYYGTFKVSDMWKFYLKLDANRRVKGNRELMDSYRHLREHGNAFFVVLLEMLLGVSLFVAGKVSIFPLKEIAVCSASDANCLAEVPVGLIQSVILILIWIIPAATVWSIGCFLESEFANDLTIGNSPPPQSPPPTPTPTPTPASPATAP